MVYVVHAHSRPKLHAQFVGPLSPDVQRVLTFLQQTNYVLCPAPEVGDLKLCPTFAIDLADLGAVGNAKPKRHALDKTSTCVPSKEVMTQQSWSCVIGGS